MSASVGRLRVDWASAALVLVGAVSAGMAYWLITVHNVVAVVIVPAVVAVTIGMGNLLKREAPRDSHSDSTGIGMFVAPTLGVNFVEPWPIPGHTADQQDQP